MTPRAYHAALALSVDPGATPAERANAARRCQEYRGTRRPDIPPRPQKRAVPIPWWTIKLTVKDGPRSGKWLGNTTEFRAVLRSLIASCRRDFGCRAYFGYLTPSCLDSCYRLDDQSADALENGLVDWTWFPMSESVGSKWRPPPEMRSAALRYKTESKIRETLDEVARRSRA